VKSRILIFIGYVIHIQARPWGAQAAQPSRASKTYGPQKNKA